MASTSKPRFHVTCGQYKKVLTSATEDLLADIDRAFNLNSAAYTIQLWNAEFDDWVDLENVAELNGVDKCKLQVILR